MAIPNCATGCSADLPPVQFDFCNPIIKASEIRRIFLAKVSAAPFTNWKDASEWTNRLSDVSVIGDNYIRTLIVIGDKPAPTGTTRDISFGRTYNTNKTHTINATIDDVSEVNHELIRALECGGTFRVWYETSGGLIFGGNEGIKVNIAPNMVLPRGVDEIMTYVLTLTWKSLFTEERADSPIFDFDPSGSSETFDTALTFAAGTTDTEAGVEGTVAAMNGTKKFEFNAITPQIGTQVTMTISVDGDAEITVEFTTDYLGSSFKYTDADGNVHYGIFAAGAINF